MADGFNRTAVDDIADEPMAMAGHDYAIAFSNPRLNLSKMKTSREQPAAYAVSAVVLLVFTVSVRSQIAPSIPTQPVGLTNNAGTTAMFTVGANGDAPLSYQWRKNGMNLTNATAPTLVLSNVLSATEGSYTVVVTNSSGAVTSVVARLTVNDPVIQQQPASEAVIEGDPMWFDVVAVGTGPLSYQWRRNGIRLSDGPNIVGTTGDTLIIYEVSNANAGTYSVDVANALGKSVTSAEAILTAIAPPRITTQPQSQEVNQGVSVVFIVVAGGTAPLRYQWFFNYTQPIPGATNSYLTLVNVHPVDEGDYTVVVTNQAVGYAAVSQGATLTVDVPPTIVDQPDGETVVEGDDVLFSVVADGTDDFDHPMTYQWRKNGYAIGGETDDTYINYGVTAADAGSYSVKIENVAGEVVSTNAILTVLIPPTITVQPNSKMVLASDMVTFAVKATGTPPLSYQWQFEGEDLAGETNSELTFMAAGLEQNGAYSCVVSNDACSDDVVSYPAELAESEDAYLTVQVELIRPTVAITSPAEWTRTTSNLTVHGTAFDNAEVSSVYWALNGLPDDANQQILAQGTTNWSATVSFTAPGTNLFRVRCRDSSANLSYYQTREFIYVPADRLRVQATGQGTLSPNYSNAWLEIGQSFSMTASGTNGYAFANWVISTNWAGGLTVTTNPLNFLMQPNLTLQVNFVDVAAPATTITAPTSGQRWSNEVFVVQGTATDNARVTNVFYQLNANVWAAAGTTNGWTNWTAAVVLTGGTNVVRAYAVDAAGNRSATNSMTFIYVTRPRLVVTSSPADSHFQFQMLGAVGAVLEIQASTNLIKWETIDVLTNDTGAAWFTDPSTNWMYRFYRVRFYRAPDPPVVIVGDGAVGFRAGRFGFNLTGEEGQVVVIEASTNLLRWTALATNKLDGNPIYFSDQSAETFRRRFYRARLQ